MVGDFVDVSYVCTLDGATIDPCTTPIAWDGLQDGDPLTVTVTATDLAANAEGPTATRTATVDESAPTVTWTEPAPGTLYGPRSDPFATFAKQGKEPRQRRGPRLHRNDVRM